MKIHIPTTQYGFIEADVENPEDARQLHDEVTEAFRTGDGIPDREFNEALDEYLTNGTGITETFLRMNKNQQFCFQSIKRHMKRMGASD